VKSKFTVATNAKLLVSGTGTQPEVGTILNLKLNINADGTVKLSDTKKADGTTIKANKLCFSNETDTAKYYAFVEPAYFYENLTDFLFQDDTGTKFLSIEVVIHSFVPSANVVKATLEV
jgi:hypothetical protein